MSLYSQFSLYPAYRHFWSGFYIMLRTPCQDDIYMHPAVYSKCERPHYAEPKEMQPH